MMVKKYIMKVIPLSVLHIGTGKELSPLDYTVNGNRYYRFSVERVIQSLSEQQRNKLMGYIDNNELADILRFFPQVIKEESVLYQLVITNSVKGKYENSLGSTNNQLLVKEMYRSKEDYLPVIPGSSLKGAIRTAIVSKYGESKSNSYLFNDKGKPYNNFENKILSNANGAQNDPFRTIRITDCKIKGKKSQNVGEAVNFKENRSRGQDFSRMQMIQEQIIGTLYGGDAQGQCELVIDEDLQRANKSISLKLSLEEIVSACNHFYKNNFEKEYQKFYNSTRYRNELKELADELKNIIEHLKDNECLIRVGRFSQVENVTIDIHRKPWNRKGWGNTRTLAKSDTHQYFPYGWVKLSFADFDEIKEQIQEAYKKALTEEGIGAKTAVGYGIFDPLEEDEPKSLKEEIKKQEEEKAKQEEERIIQEEKERIRNLSPDEKMIEEIKKLQKDNEAISHLVKEITNGDFAKEVYVQIKSKLEELGEWKPSGSPQRRQKMKGRNEIIESKIGDS